MKKLIFSFCLLILLSTPTLAQNIDLTKAIILNLEFKAGSLFLQDSRIVYNYPPNLQAAPEAELQIKILAADGQALGQYSEFDPRVIFADEFDETGKLISGGVSKSEEASWDLILPVWPTMARVVIFEGEKELLTIDTGEIFKNFCQAKNEICDPDCKAFKDPDCKAEILTPLNLGILGGAALIIILAAVLIVIKKKRRGGDDFAEPKQEPPAG